MAGQIDPNGQQASVSQQRVLRKDSFNILHWTYATPSANQQTQIQASTHKELFNQADKLLLAARHTIRRLFCLLSNTVSAGLLPLRLLNTYPNRRLQP
jgi:hypothetical protein